MKHCQHCYDAGYQAGKAATENTAPEQPDYEKEPRQEYITLTDEIRSLYGIPASATHAMVIVDGDRITAVIEYWTENEDD